MEYFYFYNNEYWIYNKCGLFYNKSYKLSSRALVLVSLIINYSIDRTVKM